MVLSDGRGEASIHAAASSPQAAAEQVTALIQAGANVNIVRSSDRRSALHLTALHGNLQSTRMLVKHAAIVDALDIGGATPLITAAESNHSDVVRYLLAQGADPERVNREAIPAWQLGCPLAFFEAGYYHPYFHRYLTVEYDEDLLYKNMNEVIELDFCIDDLLHEQFVLIGKVEKKMSVKWYRLLHEQGLFVFNNWWRLVFTVACKNAQADIIFAILNSTNNLITGVTRESALVSCLCKQKFNLFKKLSKRLHWDIDDKLSQSRCSTDEVIKERKWPMLHEMIANPNLTAADKLPILQYLIHTVKADVRISTDDLGRTPLVLACMYSPNLSIIKLLVESGARVDSNGNGNFSFLHSLIANCVNCYQQEEEICEIVAYLLNEGADAEVKNTDTEESLLVAAAKKGLIKVVTLLDRHMQTMLNEERYQRAQAEDNVVRVKNTCWIVSRRKD